MRFIPNGYWHSVISGSTSISISHEFGRKATWPQIFQAISVGGWRHWSQFIADFVRYGLLGKHFTRKLADDPPFGYLVYKLLESSLANRLKLPSST